MNDNPTCQESQGIEDTNAMSTERTNILQQESTTASVRSDTTEEQLSNPDENGTSSWEFTGSSATKAYVSTTTSTSRKGSSASMRSSIVSRRLRELTVNKLRFSDLGRLYGRDKEYWQLHEAWTDVLQARGSTSTSAACSRRCLVTIHGLKGTGKSALAESLKNSVEQCGGFFLQGKFAQLTSLSRRSIEPYQAFAAACRELCELVVNLYSAESDSNEHNKSWKFTLEEFREKLNQDVGVDAPILTRVMPSLLSLLKADGKSVESIGLLEAHHQFKFAFRRFLRAVASFGPVVLVLDDMQWADSASMELLEALISDKENPSLLVVGCCRSDNEYASLPHLQSIQNIVDLSHQDKTVTVHSITVGNLEVDSVTQLLVNLLNSFEEVAQPLAECVHRKTLGNVFFVIQYTALLQDMGLLEYNFGSMKWRWDLKEIQQSTTSTENVVTLMTLKMRRLSSSVQRVLPMMACLGSTFEATMLELVVNAYVPERATDATQNKTQELQAANVLHVCEQEGLIERVFEVGSYRWVHDIVMEAALSLMSEVDLQVLKLALGKYLLRGLTSTYLEKHLFTVVNLLNTESGDEMVCVKVSLLELANLNLQAGVKTIQSSAFVQASGYLSKGIALLPDDHWQNHYNLSLDLFSTAAEAEFCVGNFGQMRRYCDEIIGQKDLPLLDKRRAYNVLLDSTMAEHRMSDAVKLSILILSMLGCHFPKRFIQTKAIVEFFRVKATLQRLTPEAISYLPEMKDEGKLWAMRLLDKFCTCAYLAKSNLLPFGLFKSFDLSMKYGVSDFSPVAFSGITSAMTGFLKDFKKAEEYSRFTYLLLDKAKSARIVRARVLMVTNAFGLHCSRPITLSLSPLLEGYEAGMAMGDTEIAAWCAYFFLEFSFRSGASLDVLVEECAWYADQVRSVKQLNILGWILIIWQCCLNLSGRNPNTVIFSGDAMDQDEFLRQAEASRFDLMTLGFFRIQMSAAFIFNDHELVYELMRKTGADNTYLESTSLGTPGVCHIYAYGGLSMISLYRKSQQRMHLKLAKKCASKIKTWAKAGNPNVIHYNSLFDAEFSSLRGDSLSAEKHYKAGLVCAGRGGLTHDHALIHERFGEHFVRLGPMHEKDAEYHISKAMKLYKEWGSHAKVRQVLSTHRALLDSRSSVWFAVDDD